MNTISVVFSPGSGSSWKGLNFSPNSAYGSLKIGFTFILKHSSLACKTSELLAFVLFACNYGARSNFGTL